MYVNGGFMIIYLHGYGSSGSGRTATMLKKKLTNIVTPTYDYNDPRASLKVLLKIVDSVDDSENVIVVGSSLGGWYAEKIASVRNVDLVLYNPSTKPSVSLKKYGTSDNVLKDYADLTVDSVRSGVNRYVIISKDDNVVDPSLTIEKYKGRSAIVHTSGGHTMTDSNLELILDKIAFLSNSF